MPRPKRNRKISNPPHFKGFMPVGTDDDGKPVVLHLEEYEAIRLCDFELREQVEAASLMEVSRPTFTRIYESARRKIANAFVAGKPIIFEGGKVYFDSDWFICQSCNCMFSNPLKNETITYCALCGSASIEQCNEENKPV
jgi:predicted DNA-binding protein (UPF0251 family)